jgi:hypothetical protein
MFEINGSTSDGKFTWGRGGNQGGEGADVAKEWWIENVREELDGPNEYFFDRETRELFFRPNGTSTPPAAAVVPVLANLIEIRGTQATPVTGVSLLGLTLVDNRPTFFDPRGAPSGGDWALERMGAVMVEGAELLTVEGCTFTRLDSNALFLSGYTRNVSIVNNTWVSLGQNAIAAWGKPHDFNNGTSGNFPRFTKVEGNWASDLGLIQKQSSFYFQAETAQSTIRNNIVFNSPRAAINFNDVRLVTLHLRSVEHSSHLDACLLQGFGGGAEMSANLLFNTCRESSDHGAFKSPCCWNSRPPKSVPTQPSRSADSSRLALAAPGTGCHTSQRCATGPRRPSRRSTTCIITSSSQIMAPTAAASITTTAVHITTSTTISACTAGTSPTLMVTRRSARTTCTYTLQSTAPPASESCRARCRLGMPRGTGTISACCRRRLPRTWA